MKYQITGTEVLFFVEDETFPLKPNFMWPFLESISTTPEEYIIIGLASLKNSSVPLECKLKYLVYFRHQWKPALKSICVFHNLIQYVNNLKW